MNFMLSEFVICTFWFLGLVTEGITPAAAKLLDCRATVAAQRERYPDPPCWGGGGRGAYIPIFMKTQLPRNPSSEAAMAQKRAEAPWKETRVRIRCHVVWWNCSNVAVYVAITIFKSFWHRSPYREMFGLCGVFSYRISSVLWYFVFDIFTWIPANLCISRNFRRASACRATKVLSWSYILDTDCEKVGITVTKNVILILVVRV